MSRTVILPIVTLGLLVVENLFHISIPDDMGGNITDAILTLIFAGHVLYKGIFTNHRSQPPDDETPAQ